MAYVVYWTRDGRRHASECETALFARKLAEAMIGMGKTPVEIRDADGRVRHLEDLPDSAQPRLAAE